MPCQLSSLLAVSSGISFVVLLGWTNGPEGGIQRGLEVLEVWLLAAGQE